MIYLIIAVVAVVVIAAGLSACYRKAPPTEALVITGLGHKEPKVIRGKGSIVIPVLQRVDRILMRLMKVDVKTPQTGVKTLEGVPLWLDAVVTIQVYSENSTITNKEVEISGCASKEEYIKTRQQAAITNFLGYGEAAISEKVNDILQGNLREIVATMSVVDVLTKRKEFAENVIENARPDLAKMGLEVVTFNIQDIQDAVDACGEKHGVVEAIGVQREMEVKRDAETAKAKALKEIEIEQANAKRETAERKAEADRLTAEAETQLALKKAELKKEADIKRAEADAAYEIQKENERRSIEIATANANIAKQEREIELKKKQVEVTEQALEAEIKKKAEAEKFAAQQRADAELYLRQRKAEAEKFELEKAAEAKKVQAEASMFEELKKAEGIKAVADAEAEAIRAKGIAEAEAIDKKAEAMQKYGQAAMMEMIVKTLPDMARAIAEPLAQIDKISIIDGNGGSGVSNVGSYVPAVLAKTIESVKETTGMDLTEVMKANTYDAKVNKKLTLEKE